LKLVQKKEQQETHTWSNIPGNCEGGSTGVGGAPEKEKGGGGNEWHPGKHIWGGKSEEGGCNKETERMCKVQGWYSMKRAE